MYQRILVWDVPTRVYHWLQVLSFSVAYLTAFSERLRNYHVALGYILLGLLGLVAAVWILGLARNPGNPSTRHSGFIISAEADPLLKRACFDCHSNETEYPWYSYLPVSSLLISKQVKKGRRELNFSNWDNKSEKKRARALRGVVRLMKKGRMPPKDYVLINAKADLSREETTLLIREAEALGGPIPEKTKKVKKKPE